LTLVVTALYAQVDAQAPNNKWQTVANAPKGKVTRAAASAAAKKAFGGDVPATLSARATYLASLQSSNVVGGPALPKGTVLTKGTATIYIIDDTRAIGYLELNTISDVYAAHIHSGSTTTNGPPVNTAFNCSAPLAVTGKLTTTWTFDPTKNNVTKLLASGNSYFNVHTSQYPSGIVRGQFNPQLSTRAGFSLTLANWGPWSIDTVIGKVETKFFCEMDITVITCKLTIDPPRIVAADKIVLTMGGDILQLLDPMNTQKTYDFVKDKVQEWGKAMQELPTIKV